MHLPLQFVFVEARNVSVNVVDAHLATQLYESLGHDLPLIKFEEAFLGLTQLHKHGLV
jgi:hypothetical protein